MSNEEKTNVAEKSGLATAGLVLGIIGVCTSFIPIINNLSFVMGILAVIFGILNLKKTKKGKVIASIILGILAIWMTISSQQALSDSLNDLSNDLETTFNDLDGSNTNDILANDVDVQIGTFTIEKGDYYDSTKLPVKITNKSSEMKSFSITIEAVDADGNRIEEGYIMVNDLKPNQSVEETTFTFESDDTIAKLKTATFNVLKISKY